MRIERILGSKCNFLGKDYNIIKNDKKHINNLIKLKNYLNIFTLIIFNKFAFFSEKSLIKVFEQKDKFIELNKIIYNLEAQEAKLMNKIKSLGINSLDEDLITELGQTWFNKRKLRIYIIR